MVFAVGNLYPLKCWNLLAAWRTRTKQWAHATYALSLETETPQRSLKANICDGCPTVVPSLPGRFFLIFDGARTQPPCCLPSNDNAVPNDHRFCAVEGVRNFAATLQTLSGELRKQNHVS
jgi:hypothetical protein